jgi:hypothetical protein
MSVILRLRELNHLDTSDLGDEELEESACVDEVEDLEPLPVSDEDFGGSWTLSTKVDWV